MPYQLSIPAKSGGYDLLIGLYKGGRVPLVGGQRTEDRVPIARITLRRQGDKIVGIEASPPAAAVEAKEVLPDFTAHVNPPGTWIDFGLLATDGAAKVEREADRLTVFPYPRDTPFRVSLNLKGQPTRPGCRSAPWRPAPWATSARPISVGTTAGWSSRRASRAWDDT